MPRNTIQLGDLISMSLDGPDKAKKLGPDGWPS